MCVCLPAGMSCEPGQKRTEEPLALELGMVENHHADAGN